jgi:hypothetical protein
VDVRQEFGILLRDVCNSGSNETIIPKKNLPHIQISPGSVFTMTLLDPVVPVFHLDGFDYYYERDSNDEYTYYAVDPTCMIVINGNGSPCKIEYRSIDTVKKAAIFSLKISPGEFRFDRIMPKPVKIRLLAIRQMIQIHQIMIL